MRDYRLRRSSRDGTATRWGGVDWTLLSWLAAAFLGGLVGTAHYLL
jgi:hypothetical protein